MPPSEGSIRASDTERERAIAALREAAGEGRLDVSELDERIEAAYAARTRAELAALVEDLPPLPAPRRERTPARPRHRVPARLRPFVTVSLLLIAIWAVTGAGYFWPIWPIMGWGLAMARPCGHRGRHRRHLHRSRAHRQLHSG